VELAEELRTGKGGDFEVVSSQVGLRPGGMGRREWQLRGKERSMGLGCSFLWTCWADIKVVLAVLRRLLRL